MSTQKAVKTALAVSLVILAAVLGGCGDKTKVGPSSPTGQVPQTRDVSGGGASESPETPEDNGETPGTDTIASPDDPGAGDEEAVRVPVEIVFRDGAFTKSTKRTVHVPAFTPIELELTTLDATPIRFFVKYRDDEGPYNYPGRKTKRTVALGGLRPDDSYTITAGNEEIRVVADLEPGP